jgi:hypothetical protein
MKDIMSINHEPHPYVITPKHVEYASKNNSGQLSEDTIREVEKENKGKCGHKDCTFPYDEHNADTVMFLRLKRNGTSEEANTELKEMAKLMVHDMIDGFVMVETEEKFRIKNEKTGK